MADLITAGNAKHIIVMTGAGISTAAGIKDFRSPGTGLYDDLEKYNLPFPEAVFDLEFFKETPRPFYQLAKHLYPGHYQPTLTHYLLPLLAKKNLLLRSYTQNIDSLERLAGLSEDLLVEAHGSFTTSKCVQCEMTSDATWVKKHIMQGEIPYCKRCSGLVKPNITFFGENVPLRFSTLVDDDFGRCDLLIVLGTSLKVEPFNKLIAKVPSSCPRVLINREKAGQELQSGFDFDGSSDDGSAQRDALFLGNCDDGVRELAALCGWEDELQSMYNVGYNQLKLVQEKDELELQSQPLSPFQSTQKTDQGEDSEKDDHDEEDEVERKLSEAATQDSVDSLDEITHRFGRSTLLSQGEDYSVTSRDDQDASSKSLVDDKAVEGGSNLSDTKPLEPLAQEESAITQGVKEAETVTEAVAEANTSADDAETKGSKDKELDVTESPVENMDPRVEAASITAGPLEGSSSSVGLEEDEACEVDQVEEEDVDVCPGSPFFKERSLVQPTQVFHTDVGAGTTHAALLGLVTSTIAAAAVTTASSQQLFPTCIPMTVSCTTTTADVGGSAGLFVFSHNSVSQHVGGSAGSNYGYAGRSDGSMISQQMRRKRRMDFESQGAGHGNGGGGGKQETMRYLRGPSVPGHNVGSGRVQKKRRCV